MANDPGANYLNTFQNDPGVRWATSNGATLSQTNVQAHQDTADHRDTPAAPDYSSLRALQAQIQRHSQINSALKDYDQLYASTQAQGFQSANNAGNVYANRLIQSGVNPLASGVVAAQAKLPIYSQLAQINQAKDQTRLDAVNKADALSAQIAGQIAQLQLGYSKTLADYNSQQTQYQLDLSKFSSSQQQQASQFQQDYRLRAASLAQQGQQFNAQRGGSNLSGHTINAGNAPGYIPDFGVINPGTGSFAGNGHTVAVGY